VCSAVRERVPYYIFRSSDAHKLRFPIPTHTHTQPTARHFATPGRLTPYTTASVCVYALGQYVQVENRKNQIRGPKIIRGDGDDDGDARRLRFNTHGEGGPRGLDIRGGDDREFQLNYIARSTTAV